MISIMFHLLLHKDTVSNSECIASSDWIKSKEIISMDVARNSGGLERLL
jgi:hypothetical protein